MLIATAAAYMSWTVAVAMDCTAVHSAVVGYRQAGCAGTAALGRDDYAESFHSTTVVAVCVLGGSTAL